MNIGPFISDGVFSPEDIGVMARAYELACQGLRADSQPALMQEIIAKRLIALARDKSWEANRLADQVLLSLGFL